MPLAATYSEGDTDFTSSDEKLMEQGLKYVRRGLWAEAGAAIGVDSGTVTAR